MERLYSVFIQSALQHNVSLTHLYARSHTDSGVLTSLSGDIRGSVLLKDTSTWSIGEPGLLDIHSNGVANSNSIIRGQDVLVK